jgi:N-acetylglucosaminyl-diphospho-decaprenol L-rhamnosyltransferase
MSNLAIIIVNWNVRDLLAACLRTVLADLAASNLSGQIWVVDNASSDGSLAMLRRDFPQITLIASDKNLGFARGNNAALRAMGFQDQGHEVNSSSDPLIKQHQKIKQPSERPEAVLLLNPDTQIHPGTLPIWLNFLKSNDRVGIVGAQLLNSDGSFQHSAFAFPGLWQLAIELLPLPSRLAESRFNGRYPRSCYERDQPFKVGHPLGAAMCVRRETIEQVGLLDERYHMYVEEIDWCKRITSAGWEIYCLPQARVTHFGGQSTGQIQTDSFINLWTSRYQFYRKHYGVLKVWLAARIVQAGMRRKAIRAAQANRRGAITDTELVKRLESYKKVMIVWRGKEELPYE